MLLVGLVALYFLTATELPVTDDDRAVLLTASAIAEWVEDFEPDAASETTTKLKYLDGTVSLEYEYDSVKESDPYLSCTIDIVGGETEARATLATIWTAMVITIEAGSDTVVKENNDLFRWGDKSHCATLESAGVPFGNFFMAQKDGMVVTILVEGVCFDTTELLTGLLLPRLKRLASYTPVK